MKGRFATTSWFRRNLVAFAIALAVALVIFVAYILDAELGGTLGSVESKLVNLRFLMRGPRAPSGEVVIVGIDSKSTDQLGRWPWSRTVHAALIDRLREWGASAVAFDVLFSETEGVAEAARLRRIAATLPEDDDSLEATRVAIDQALEEVQVDEIFIAAMERTFEDNAALTVLALNFVLEADLSHTGHLGRVLSPDDAQIVLDRASYMSRDENSAIMRTDPPMLVLGVRPVVTHLADWAAYIGFVNPTFDNDGSLRREQMVMVYSPSVQEAIQAGEEARSRLQNQQVQVEAYMPLAVAGVAAHLRLGIDQLILDLHSGRISTPQLSHRFNHFDGSTRLDFYGSSKTFPTHSFIDVLSDSLINSAGNKISGPAAFAGKLVFVGVSDPGIGDFFVTPFTARLPGVEKHATVAENMLSGHQIYAHQDEVLVVGLSVLVVALVTAVLVANLSTLWSGGILALLSLCYLGYTFNDFIGQGLLWNWFVPLTTLLLGYAGVAAYRGAVERLAKRAMEARGRFIQQTFSRYLSDEVVEVLVESPEGLRLGGERRRLTILMSDLRGFTAMSERSEPEVVTSLLNFYLGRMTEVIFKHGGTVDEFIGDAILALFGAPVKRDDDAQRAIACAVEMQQAMGEVNRRLAEMGLPEVEMGVAINTGEVIVGNIGSEKRAKYGVVGTNVNLTARIESFTVGGQVYISGETLAEAGSIVRVGAKIEVNAKGLVEPIPAYEVLGIGGTYKLEMPRVKEELRDLDEPIAVEYAVLEGKQITDSMLGGELVRLSAIGTDLRCELELEPLTNLKLKVMDQNGRHLEGDLYAKVIDRESAAGTNALRFTSTPPAVKKHLDSIRKA
jgi:class 3 adenylate cyclase